MITCYVRYVIEPSELEVFEQYAKNWMRIVRAEGGTHHGYFMPGEGANNIALALFSFPSFATYEEYRKKFGVDPDFIEASKIRRGCILSYERSFFKPMFD